MIPGVFFRGFPMNGDLFSFESVYDVLQRDFPLCYGLRSFVTMATKTAAGAAERQVIADALDMYVKSLERAERAAKEPAIAAAYRDAAGKVRSLQARVTSGELEI